MKDFLYKTTFAAELKPIISQEKDKFLSLAAADKLKSIIPESVRGENDIDLLPFAASLCNVGRANRNGDLIGSEVALAYYKSFYLRGINSRHKVSELCGVIVNTGVCRFDSEEVITEEEAKTLSIYNIAVAGIIYRRVNPELADYLEEGGDPTSPYYGDLSLSWEIGFSEYDILIGSPYISEGKVISNDSGSFADYDKLLTANGGAGRDSKGNPVYRLIKGQIYPLGAGIVEKPAAYVKGIMTDTIIPTTPTPVNDETPEHELTESPEEETMEDQMDQMDDMEGKCAACGEVGIFTKVGDRYACAKCDTSYSGSYFATYQDAYKQSMSDDKNSIVLANSLDNNKLNANPQEMCVNKKEKIMKITKIEDITDESLKETTASVMSDFISSELQKACDKYTGEIKSKDEMITNAQTAISDLNKSIEELRAKISESDAKEASRTALEQLNVRLAAFDDKYNLSDEARATIGGRIKGMDETAFAEYEKELSVLFKDNVKTKVSTAAVVEDSEVSAAQAVASAASTQTTVTPPNVVAPVLSLKDRMKEAFSFNKVVTNAKR